MNMHSYLLILVMSLVTAFIRFAPFVIFQKKTPAFITYLGKTLPPCAMAMLVVYCFKDISLEISGMIPQAISALLVILLYKWKHNTALSIVISTIIYMILIQKIF